MKTTFYYPQQYGGALPAFRGGVMQRGYGIGGIFKGLMRIDAPKLKSIGKQLGASVLKTGLQTIGDVARGENLCNAVKRAKENFFLI